jgi:hypothetical protein
MKASSNKSNRAAEKNMESLFKKFDNISVLTEEEEAEEFLKKLKKIKGSSPKKIQNTSKVSKITKKENDNRFQTILDNAFDKSTKKKKEIDNVALLLGRTKIY